VSAEDLYENAPCGYISTDADRRIITVNATLSRWLGYAPGALVGRPFTDLLTVGSRIHYETHFSPLLHVDAQFSGVSAELVSADGVRLPVFISANAKTGADGRTEILRIVFQDASDRRSYEREPRYWRGLCSARCFHRRCHPRTGWKHAPTSTPPRPTK
jgi:sigma-B regulation protein RsbU (phosphoserine phosphatase)